ncbi:MAG: dTMP kinase [Candidatus Hodarchaeales archaeon]|jgi:dTMP kinase
MSGKFIVFEGVDGSGLSTHSRLLKEYLLKKGKTVIQTKEQTDGAIGGLIKSCLKKEWKSSPLALKLLFTADRAHHLANEIEPALEQDKIVICDRYIFSTIAFGALGVDEEFLKTINSKFRKPDLTFIMNCPADVCLKRIGEERFSQELFEEKEKMEKIRDNYLSLKDYFPDVFVVDTNRPKEEVFEEIKKVVDAKIS